MFILNRIFFALNGFAILALLLSYSAPYISPELYWPIAFLGLAYPVIVALNLVFIVYWIAVFKLKFLYSFIALCAGYNFVPSYVQFSAKKTVEKENTLQVLDFNMKNFGAFEKTKHQEPDKFFDVYDKLSPNLLCFQEFHDFNSNVEHQLYKKLFMRLKGYYAYNVYVDEFKHKNGHDMVVFSKFPIIDSGKVEHGVESGNFTIFVDIVAYGDTIRVINTHLQSIRFDAPEYQVMKNIKVPDDSTVSALTNISRKLKIAFIKRAKMSEAISDFIELSPYKVIVAGDFNDSPSSYAYRTVKNNLMDAFVESGSGLGRTYVGTAPSFRIDYILHDPSFTSYNYFAKAFEFSDHKMLSCTIKLK